MEAEEESFYKQVREISTMFAEHDTRRGPGTLLTEEGRTPQTVNRYLAFLRRVLNKAVREGKIAINPVSRLKMVREFAGKTRFLTPDEEHRLCDALGPDYAVWVRIALLTGMRQLEQFSLRWTDGTSHEGSLLCRKRKPAGCSMSDSMRKRA